MRVDGHVRRSIFVVCAAATASTGAPSWLAETSVWHRATRAPSARRAAHGVPSVPGVARGRGAPVLGGALLLPRVLEPPRPAPLPSVPPLAAADQPEPCGGAGGRRSRVDVRAVRLGHDARRDGRAPARLCAAARRRLSRRRGSPAGERRRSCWRRLAGRVRPARARAAPPRRVRALQADDGAAAGRVPGAARAEPGAAR